MHPVVTRSSVPYYLEVGIIEVSGGGGSGCVLRRYTRRIEVPSETSLRGKFRYVAGREGGKIGGGMDVCSFFSDEALPTKKE